MNKSADLLYLFRAVRGSDGHLFLPLRAPSSCLITIQKKKEKKKDDRKLRSKDFVQVYKEKEIKSSGDRESYSADKKQNKHTH